MVVICLKNRTFAVSQTTLRRVFKHFFSCDLLEKSYFCSITNNYRGKLLICSSVVICLKNRTFAVSQTTCKEYVKAHMSCDLLEKSYFCSITNNIIVIILSIILVVICLKNRTFAVSQTTPVDSWLYVDRCDLLEKSYFCSITNNSTSS